MLNKNVVESTLTDIYANNFLDMIVQETFMTALPVDKSTMSRDEAINLYYYAKNVTKSIGGIKALESSFDIEHKTPEQNMFLAGIYYACTESAKECAKKKCNNPEICNSNDSLQDVIQKATLSKEDCAKFAKRADSMNLDEVADIIKKKTLQVISDEKEQYEKEKKLDDELSNALSESDKLDDLDPGESDLGDDLELEDEIEDGNTAEESSNYELDPSEKSKQKFASKPSKTKPSANGPSKPVNAIESFKDFHLDPTEPRHHVTLFSRLQDTAMEMMSFINTPNYGRDYFPILEATTFESVFKKPKKEEMRYAQEASTVAKEEICEIPSQTRPKVATLISIITYTIMETLNTMGIFTPSKNTLRKFVDTTSNSVALQKKAIDESCDTIRCAVKESAMLDFSKMSSTRLGQKLTTLKTALENAQTFIDENGASTDMINIASEAVKHIGEIESILTQRTQDHQALSAATESFQTKRQKENDLSEFNRINGLYKSNPRISQIRLLVNPNQMQSIIDVECANESGEVIRRSYMNMEYACEADQYLKYLDDMYHKSNLAKLDKEVCIKLKDGKGTTITL